MRIVTVMNAPIASTKKKTWTAPMSSPDSYGSDLRLRAEHDRIVLGILDGELVLGDARGVGQGAPAGVQDLLWSGRLRLERIAVIVDICLIGLEAVRGR